MARKKPKSPFPYFGGKSAVAPLVWQWLGDVDNFIEPFFGSGAVLLGRPHSPRVETANDADTYLANFWRATQHDPEAVAFHADYPVNEADMHARHRYLVLGGPAAEFRKRMRTDPDYYDARFAGWWCWGLCLWIGAGWCVEPDKPTGHGVLSNGPAGGSGKRSVILGGGKGQLGHGVHAKGKLWQKQPHISDPNGQGVHAAHRPQLADAYARGRGVHANDEAGTCAERQVWLLEWFGRLRDRFRTVRVCCGDWLRVCDSESVTTRLGTTGIFFDPPYGLGADRDKSIYATDSLTVAADVRQYCLERGGDPRMRIVLAGYEGEGHDILEQHGWTVEAWQAQGGYGNRSEKGKENAKKERLWISPHCLVQRGLFDDRP